MARTLITAQTGASTSEAFRLTDRELPAKLSASGLAGAEVISLEESSDDGSSWVDLGTVNELTLAEPSRCLDCMGLYRVVKGVTAGSVGVAVTDGNSNV